MPIVRPAFPALIIEATVSAMMLCSEPLDSLLTTIANTPRLFASAPALPKDARNAETVFHFSSVRCSMLKDPLNSAPRKAATRHSRIAML